MNDVPAVFRERQRSRDRRRASVFVLAVAVLLGGYRSWAVEVSVQTGAGAVDRSATADRPAVGGMRAQLFRVKTGDWSEDLLAAAYRGGWNAIAGSNATNALLVVVEISGAPGGTYTGFFGPATKFSVRLAAREVGRKPAPAFTRTVAIPVLNEQGKVYVPFLLYPRGCAQVHLTAIIVGEQPSAPFEKTLPFACGE
jgi:hypothetical protein